MSTNLARQERQSQTLSREVRLAIAADVRRLSTLETHKTLLAVTADWLWILAAAVTATYSGSWFVYALAMLVIASRQHALLHILHEGSHHRISTNAKLNDGVSDYFAAFPLFFSTENYRSRHTLHHRHLNTELDPDWVRKRELPEWQFPMARGSYRS